LLERSFKQKFMKELQANFPNAYLLKTHFLGRAGVPDLLICVKGYFLALELKTQTGQATKLQLAILSKIEKAGGFTRVVRPSNSKKTIEEIHDLLAT